jgi:hypothetical protein
MTFAKDDAASSLMKRTPSAVTKFLSDGIQACHASVRFPKKWDQEISRSRAHLELKVRSCLLDPIV